MTASGAEIGVAGAAGAAVGEVDGAGTVASRGSAAGDTVAAAVGGCAVSLAAVAAAWLPSPPRCHDRGRAAGTLPCPLRSTTLACRKASPDPSASCTKPNPLSGLYHLTTAWTGGPAGASNLWALDPGVDPKPRRGVSKLSSSKPRRRVGRKSLSLLLTGVPGSSGILPL